jgi:hypothetical protein
LPVVLAILGLPLVCLLAITRGTNRKLRWRAPSRSISSSPSRVVGDRNRRARPRGAAEHDPPRPHPTRIDFHEQMAEQIPLLAIATTALLLLGEHPAPDRAADVSSHFRCIASVVTAAWVVVTGHSGGVAVVRAWTRHDRDAHGSADDCASYRRIERANRQRRPENQLHARHQAASFQALPPNAIPATNPKAHSTCHPSRR